MKDRTGEREVGWILTGVVLAAFSAAVVWPAVGVLGGVRGSGEGVNVGLLLGSVGVAALIAMLAVVAAWPGAWVVRGARGAGAVLVVAPMLLPSYLAYTGWGVIRAPDSAIGKWMMTAGPAWLPSAAGYVLAVLGLMLWVWPLAAVIVGLKLRRVEDGVLEALSMEAGGGWRSRAEVVWMCRGAVGAAIGVVMLVMLGSAVPLHLAQLDTYAIKIWRVLDQTARGEQGRVWVSAWPLVVVSLVAGFVITRRVLGVDVEELQTRRRGRGFAAAMVVWAAAVVAPVALMAGSVRSWHGTGVFLRLIGGPLGSSAIVGVCVAVVMAIITVWMWVMLAGRWRVLGAAVGTGLLVTGLLPGILVGSATAQAWSRPGVAWVGDSLLIVVLAHVARFGMVGVMAGWWLAATEGRWLRDLRKMDAGESVKGWLEGAVLPQVGVILAAAVGAGLLSFHEIEATVMVQPASSSGGSFAWQMLQWLHFARMDDLAKGVLVVVGIGVAGFGGVWAGVRWSKRV